MIRWYDYVASGIFAYGIMYFFFTLPAIGAFISYGIYILWTEYYCRMRKQQEDDEWR
tara:strand:+ start:678 stop:848 length:171 start_codon:yes stop_codon:yes gene_type:complete